MKGRILATSWPLVKYSNIVKLVKVSWKVSFARVQQNQKAELHQGWGPRALNKDVLLKPKVLASRTTPMEDATKKWNKLSSSLPPSELNISEELAGNLVQCITRKRGDFMNHHAETDDWGSLFFMSKHWDPGRKTKLNFNDEFGLSEQLLKIVVLITF
jgi:hypothetical protein